jgi:hypothetical protein
MPFNLSLCTAKVTALQKTLLLYSTLKAWIPVNQEKTSSEQMSWRHQTSRDLFSSKVWNKTESKLRIQSFYLGSILLTAHILAHSLRAVNLQCSCLPVCTYMCPYVCTHAFVWTDLELNKNADIKVVLAQGEAEQILVSFSDLSTFKQVL